MASNKWVFPFSPTLPLAPSVGSDGTLYFGAGRCYLYALHPDGSIAWVTNLQPQFQYQINFRSTPAIGPDGDLYFVAGGRLYRASSSGSVMWEYVTDNSSASLVVSPALAADGTVYIGSTYGSTLYAVSTDGTPKWSFQLSSGGVESSAIGPGGCIYYAAGYLYAFNPQGTNLWASGNEYRGSPVIGPSGTLYLADSGRALYAVSHGGQMLWQAITSSPSLFTPTTPAVDAAGNIYYCASNSVWMVNPQGAVQWQLTQPGDPGPGGEFALTSPAIGPDGTLYVALGPTLYAIATGTNGPANSPWPMYQQNARHTGKLERPSLTRPQKRADANFEFQLYPQQLGLTFTIQTSPDTRNWTSITSLVVNTLPIDIADLTASNAPVRFYRAFSSP
jgi:outer membrane protein assembly factor BamB